MAFGNEVADVLETMRRGKKQYKDYLPLEAVNAGKKMMGKVEGLWEDVRQSLLVLLKKELPYGAPHAAVWWYSVLLWMGKDPVLFHEFVRYVRRHKDVFSPNTQCFLCYQFSRLLFLFQELNSDDNIVELWQFYKEMTDQFAAEMETPLELIPFADRNENVVLVVTEQFLEVEHGPTKTALDRCKALIEKMGKDVLLINSAEMMTMAGKIPFFNTAIGGHLQKKSSENAQYWKGAAIPYYQCKGCMPDREEIDQLLMHVRSLAPGWVVTIGRGGILGNLIGKMIPSISIGTVPSGLSITCTKYQTLGRKLTECDANVLAQVGYAPGNVIESIFTSSLKPQQEHLTREEAGIPKNTFLMAVVGGRLDVEVVDGFLEMLEQLLRGNMHVVFWGKFGTYRERMERFPNLKEKSSYLGFCEDILSRLELCDLYINPKRKGGGYILRGGHVSRRSGSYYRLRRCFGKCWQGLLCQRL